MDFKLIQQVKVLNGRGCISQIGEMLKESGYKKAFIVTTKGRRKLAEKIGEILDKNAIASVIFDKVLPDPPSDIVEEGAKYCKSENCDCVVAVGGGSSIDCAKGINILRFNEGSIIDYTTKAMNKCEGLITVPTTSGTGSELSNGAIITDSKTGAKLPVLCFNCMPEYAVLDPELTVSMPAGVTRDTGLDTFSHAVEAYTSVLADPMTSVICEAVMRTVAENLKLVCDDGNNIDAREKMQSVAGLGGWMLYNNCAHVGHSFAHVTGAELHIVHGQACAYGLPSVLRLISSAVPEKVKKIGEILGAGFDGNESNEEIGNKTAEAYIKFTKEVGLPPVKDFGLTEKDFDDLAEKIVKEPFAGLTPVKVDKQAALKLLKEAFAN